MKKLILILFICLTFTLPVFGADHYFDATDGSDAGAGTSGDPWQTISKAETECTSGDTCYFASEETWFRAVPMLTAATGVTYDGSTYGSGTRAIFSATGDAASQFNKGIIRIDVSNVELIGFDLDGNDYDLYGINACDYNVPADFSNVLIDDCIVHDIGSVRGIYIGPQTDDTTISDVTIINTAVYDVAGAGIVIYPQWGGKNSKAEDILIRNCTVYNTTSVSGSIYIKDDVDNIIVEYCNIYDNFRGIQLEESEYEGDQWIDNATIRYNLIYNNTATGINFTPRGYIIDVDIYSNIIYNNGKGTTVDGFGIHIPAADFGGSTINIYNNTIYQGSMSAIDSTRGQCLSVGLNGSIGSPTNLTLNFRNNILYASQDPYYAIYMYTDAITHNNNLIFEDSSAIYAVRIGSTTYTNNEVTDFEATAQKTDPTFTGGTLPTGFSGTYGSDMVPDQPYFSISSGDALDNGATFSSPYNGCINGAGLANTIIRPQGAIFDIGAYEYVTDTNPTISITGSGTTVSNGANLQ